MKAVIIIVILIEIFFLILSNYYLINKNKVRYVNKYIMLLICFITYNILNCIIIDLFNYTYKVNYNNNEISKVKNNINLLELYNDELIEELDKLKLELSSDNIITLKNELENNNNYNKDILDSIKNKEIELKELNEQINNLTKENDLLMSKSSYVIKDFPTYNQFPNYPNGCESVALHLLLKYNGVEVSVEDIVEKLKKGDRPFKRNGKLYGGDPLVEFVGDPRSKNGYGVYEKPIIDVANTYKNGIKNITGTNLIDVLKIVKSGKPVQVWASINLNDTYICSTWTSTSTGVTVNWLCGLHSLVVIGYTFDEIITSDPYTGKIEYYDKTQFEKIYNIYGKRAIYYE